MKTTLIAGNSLYGQSAAKRYITKVQRLDRKIVDSSESKRVASNNSWMMI